jgi:hypothetical protein
MKTFVLLEIDHRKEIKDLTDLCAGRTYTLDGVTDVSARILSGGVYLLPVADRMPVVDRGPWYGGPKEAK